MENNQEKLTRDEVMDNDELFNKALKVGGFLYARMSGFSGLDDAQMTAIDYATYFGDEGLDDILGYVRYADENYEEDKKSHIGATLGHDINGMANRCFCPRTDGYRKYLTH